MTEARQLLIDEFDEKYTLSQVSNIIADLGFEYSAPALRQGGAGADDDDYCTGGSADGSSTENK